MSLPSIDFSLHVATAVLDSLILTWYSLWTCSYLLRCQFIKATFSAFVAFLIRWFHHHVPFSVHCPPPDISPSSFLVIIVIEHFLIPLMTHNHNLHQGPANFLGGGPKCQVISSSGPNLASTENTVYTGTHMYIIIYYISFIKWIYA